MCAQPASGGSGGWCKAFILDFLLLKASCQSYSYRGVKADASGLLSKRADLVQLTVGL